MQFNKTRYSDVLNAHNVPLDNRVTKSTKILSQQMSQIDDVSFKLKLKRRDQNQAHQAHYASQANQANQAKNRNLAQNLVPPQVSQISHYFV